MPDLVAQKVEAFDALNRSVTVSASTQISKGMLMTLTDPNTAVKASAVSASLAQPPAGIANAEKDSADASTELGLWKKGIFDAVASGAIRIGEPIVFVEAGHIAAVPTIQVSLALVSDGSSVGIIPAASMGIIAGRSREVATDGERIEFELDIP